MDLFGPSLMDDLVDTTASTSRALPRSGTASVPEVDLFANADFHSATPATGSHSQVYPSLVSSDTFLIIHFILHILRLSMLYPT
jgi:epsin